MIILISKINVLTKKDFIKCVFIYIIYLILNVII